MVKSYSVLQKVSNIVIPKHVGNQSPVKYLEGKLYEVILHERLEIPQQLQNLAVNSISIMFLSAGNNTARSETAIHH